VKRHGVTLEVKGVHKKLVQTLALRGVDMTCHPGMLNGLIGPDGAGKTTLMRTLAGLLSPDKGSVHYTEQGARLAFAKLKPSLAYMPQTQSLYPDLSVGEHLDFFRDMYELPEAEYQKRRKELLDITRLAAFVERPAGKLSGGMYKKLGLMCAMLQNPKVLLLDEPTNGVDPISRREFWDLLYRLVAEGVLVLVATAYMDEAERCGHVTLLELGQTLAEGDPQALLRAAKVPSFDALFLAREKAAAA
jgi:ABC-2 type transport system ATP-binding protein